MSDAMRVEVVSPERVLFSGEATQVITRTLGGVRTYSTGVVGTDCSCANNFAQVLLDTELTPGGLTVRQALLALLAEKDVWAEQASTNNTPGTMGAVLNSALTTGKFIALK